ncbi:tRNA ligase 1 [Leucoagaricus sp. SymC.cos]|nr:tRNA ligase 1 [Leucoagaricus sp. SymC.cos]
MPPPQYSTQDSQLISDLHALSQKSPKLVRSSVYPAPAAPNTLVRSWKMNEFKYYDIPSPFPTLARGLFTTEIEPESEEDAHKPVKYRIVARGYDKFFNIGEVPWTTWEALEAHTAPPYILSLKSNGCIIFIAALTSKKLLITSKHSLGPIEGVPLSHAQAGERWLKRYLEEKGKTEAEFAKRLWDENWTAVAELCDDSFEEHVLPYPEERTGLHLHGLNVSTNPFVTMPHQVVDAFAEEWGFIKTRTHTVNTIAEVRAFTDQNAGEWEGEAVEGFVVRTHVTEPPIEGRGGGSKKVAQGQSPYAPGSSFFFKVKFDEPYMMYRDWREMTKKLLSSKGSLSAKSLPKGKMKRKETKIYVKWVIEEIKKNRKAFDGYTKGHGIIATREKFLKWYAEQQGGSGEELKKMDEQSDPETHEDGVEGEESPKVIIVPVAIPGCGKTSVALALAHLFDWGHTQSDDVKAKKPAPTFLKNVQKLMYNHDVVIADKNNHLTQHRQQLRDLTGNFNPRARLVALNWSLSGIAPSTVHRICSDRIVSRGENHQTLVSNTSSPKSHEDVLWMFINGYEELTPREVNEIVDMELEDNLEQMIAHAVDGLIKEIVRDVIGGYKVGRSLSRDTGTKKDEVKQEKKAEKKSKPPRYFGLLPEVDLHQVLDAAFTQTAENETMKNGAEFWNKLKTLNRVTTQPHITIVHMKQLPQDKELWDKAAPVNDSSSPPMFECKLGHVLWDGREGEAFLDAVPEMTRNGLHVTVGTAASSIMPVEGKELVARWRAGARESKGVFGIDLGDATVVVQGRLKGLLA